MDTDEPFRIDGNKVWLSADARYWAAQWGLSDTEMARYLLQRSRQGDDEYGFQRGGRADLFDLADLDDANAPDGPVRNYLPYSTPSEYVEDRHEDQYVSPPPKVL